MKNNDNANIFLLAAAEALYSDGTRHHHLKGYKFHTHMHVVDDTQINREWTGLVSTYSFVPLLTINSINIVVLALHRPWQQRTHYKVKVLIIIVSNRSRFVVKCEGTDSDVEKNHINQKIFETPVSFFCSKESWE